MNAEDDELSFKARCCNCCFYHWRGWLIFLVPTFLLPLLFLEPTMEYRCAYLVAIMAIFWVSEVIPLYVTSTLPIVALPVMGIMNSEDVCLAYFTDSLMLFFGGLVVALAIEYSNLHKRVGLNIILIVGCSPRKLHFSLIFVSMFASMWISNSAATAMMCPVIKAVLEELSAEGMTKMVDETKDVSDTEPPYPSKAVLCYYLGVAYAASIGGCGTLIGTGTNLTFKGIYDTRFPDAKDVNFTNFMAYNIPVMLVNTVLVYIWLQWLYMGLFRPNSPEAQEVDIGPEGIALTRKVIEEKHKELGPMTMHEVQVAILFVVMVVLFITRKPGFFPGWGELLSAKAVKNSAPVILLIYLFFALPVNYVFMKYFVCLKPANERPLPSLMSWSFIQKRMPWGLLLLLGGGFGLAAGIKESGFAVMLGNALSILKVLPPPLVQFFCIFAGIFTTNFSANVAMCSILMPVVLEMAVAIEVHPLYLALPCAMGISCAFLFPVSTPPNAIAAGFANIRTKDMAVAGIGPSIITLFSYFINSQTLAFVVFKSYSVFPEWARQLAFLAPPGSPGAPKP